MLKILTKLAFLSIIFLTLSCAPSTEKQLEEIDFAVDAADFDTAITAGEALLTTDSTNFEGALLLSKAYAGRAGISTADLLETLIETVGVSVTGTENNDFQVIRNAMASLLTKTASLSDLRNSVLSLQTGTDGKLTDLPATTSAIGPEFYQQLALLELLEIFGRPTLLAKPASVASTTNQYDTSTIVAADQAIIQSDCSSVDDNFVNAGITSSDLRSTILQNCCTLYVASNAAAFTLNELRDLMRCQLDTNLASDFTATPLSAFESTAAQTLITGTALQTGCLIFDFTACTSATEID